mmetsp:Transcript_38460/g.115321  ORF Transcript_38460/g.115321 Transcript_38460/m.115321 type:complete len:747 (-) Transcript_38460:197-2437(-)
MSSFSGCSVSEYYPPSLWLYDPTQLHDLLQSTHRAVVPYTSSAPDCWDALIALDSADGGAGNLVNQIYSSTNANAVDAGQTHSWNREHVWPKSRGVGYNGPDFTDLHALRPSDWNVNAARSNRHFAPCGIAEVITECVSPAHSEAAVDTERDSYTFLPPKDRRGDVARATFYMVMRYDGSETDTLDLTLTDCPAFNSVDDGKLGYLSHLLQWHEEDPVDDAERARNDAVCSDWQGNRNPFVDYPALVEYIFGAPRKSPSVDGGGYDCTAPNPSGPVPPPAPPTSSPTPSPVLAPGSGGGGTCVGLNAGDVMPIGMRSDNPDVVVLMALADVTEGAEIYITDNAWTGTEFKTNEGVKKFIVPTGGLAAGSVFGYNDASLPHYSLWTHVSGSFSLSSSADAVHVYCLGTDPLTGQNTVPYHLSALSYSNSGWSSPDSDPSAFTSGQSALPDSLPGNAVVTLPHRDNYRYNGVRSGTRSALLGFISAPVEWSGGDNAGFDVTSGWIDFTVTADATPAPTPAPTPSPTPNPTPQPTPAPVPDAPAGTCATLTGGDVMIAGYNADNPDSVALVALADLPGGVELYLTDAAWTGSNFKSNEGTQTYAVPPGGIAKGTVFGYGGGFDESWTALSGSFALSVSGDAVFVYCIDESPSSSIVHLSGLTYSTNGWSDASTNEGDFTSSKSALPSELCPTCSVIVSPHRDNAVYVGNRMGTKEEILTSMSDGAGSHWSGDNSNRYDLKFMLGLFVVN